MALEGPTSVGERMRVKCLFCPQWMEGGKLSDHLKDFHRIAFHVGPPETSSCSTQTERHGSSRKRQEKRDKHREERRKHKRAAPPPPAAATSTPKKHQLEFKPSAFPVSSTAEAQTDDLESTYMEVDNIKLESEVEPQQEYFEDIFQAQNPVQSESQSSDAGQNCVDNQTTDSNTQTEQDIDTEEDSQAEDSNVASRRKNHRKEATKRQRSLKKKTRSKFRNITSGASMMYSFVESAGDTIVDARNFSEADTSVPHCPQINYTPTTPRKAKDINVIVRQQLARRVQSRLENRKPSVGTSPQTPENGKSKEIQRLRDGLHELFSSAKVRRRVDATTRRQLPQKKSRRSKDRSRQNTVKVDANPLVRSRHFGQKSPTKNKRRIPNEWSKLQREIDRAKDSQDKKMSHKTEPSVVTVKTRQRGRPLKSKTRSSSKESPSFPVSPRELNRLKDRLTGFFSPPRSTRSTANRRSFKTFDSERAQRNKMRLKKIKLASKIGSDRNPLDENICQQQSKEIDNSKGGKRKDKVGFEPNSKTTKLKQIEEEIERRRQIYAKSKLLPRLQPDKERFKETPRSSPRTKLSGESLRQKRARSVSGEGEGEDGSPQRKMRRRRSTLLELNSTPGNGSKDALRRNQTVDRRSMRSGENQNPIEEGLEAEKGTVNSPRAEPRRKEAKSLKLNESEVGKGKEERRDLSSIGASQSNTIKYKVCLDNTEMVDTPNISPKCRNRKMDPTTYLYSDTLRRKLRRRERAEAQTAETETLNKSHNVSSSNSKASSRSSSVVPVQAWYASHFTCIGCSKKYNCR